MSHDRKTAYLILWWMSQAPYAALFDSKDSAEASANVRNALLLTLSGENMNVDSVVDYYRRDDEGNPMPAEWRDVLGQPRTIPWMGMRAAASV